MRLQMICLTAKLNLWSKLDCTMHNKRECVRLRKLDPWNGQEDWPSTKLNLSKISCYTIYNICVELKRITCQEFHQTQLSLHCRNIRWNKPHPPTHPPGTRLVFCCAHSFRVCPLCLSASLKVTRESLLAATCRPEPSLFSSNKAQ